MERMFLEKKLCLKFCSYYKPSKDDDLACRGFLVIERLIKRGKKITFKKNKSTLDSKIEKILKKHLCISCPFYENDCDFAVEKENALPCGGFILLGHLLEINVLTVEDINCVG